MYDKWKEVRYLINKWVYLLEIFWHVLLASISAVTYASHEQCDASRQCNANGSSLSFLSENVSPGVVVGVVEDSWRCWMFADHTGSDSRAEAGGLARSGDGNDLMFSTSEYLWAIIAYKSSHHRPQVKTINHSTQLIIQINRQGIICTSSLCICLRLAWGPSRVGLDI